MNTDLKIKIGQMLMAGFPTPEADEQAKALVNDFCVGNFVLFARNFVDYKQTGRMCGDLSQLVYSKTGIVPIISTDQEGGSTVRTAEGAAMFPGSMAAAAADADAYILGRNCADVLTAIGVNTNLAPVVDVNSNPMNPIIGVRSFGDTAEKVKKYALSELAGMKDGGLIATCKHYPGHGNVHSDSHLTVPNNPANKDELYNIDFEPFRAAFAAGADALMSCHVVFDSMDPENPATLSYRIMTELLRNEMHFTGIAMTDCLEMGAIGKTYGSGEGAVKAVEAGCDLLCISHTYEACKNAAESLYAAVESGRLTEERINLSYERIMAVKRKYGLVKPFVFDADKADTVIHSKERIKQNAAFSRKSITLLKDNGKALSKIGSKTAFIAPCALALTGVDNEDKSPANFAKAAAARFGAEGKVLPLKVMDDETKAYIQNCEAESFVLGLFNGRFFEGQQEALMLLENSGKPLVCVLFGAPYDAGIIKNADAVIAAYEYTPLSMNSVIDTLVEKTFVGRLPVDLNTIF